MLRFLTGESHRVRNNFKYIDWQDLTKKIEHPLDLGGLALDAAKSKSEIIAASDALDKTKETILAHNNFTMLRLDLDDTRLDIDGIEDALRNMGIASFIIHTTASHQQNNNGNRFRVYIELAASLTYDTWATVETYLCYVFMADDCATRPQQIMYLPVRFNGDQYRHRIVKGSPLDISKSELLKNATLFREQQASHMRKAEEVQQIQPNVNEGLVGNQVSIIEAVNQSYDWDSLLLSYGYKRQGSAYLPPESTSNAAGVYILSSNVDDKKRYYSHHENDPCATGKCLDIFDVITIRSYSGDAKKALASIAKQHFPKLDKHNKKEWAIQRKNSRIKVLSIGVSK